MGFVFAYAKIRFSHDKVHIIAVNSKSGDQTADAQALLCLSCLQRHKIDFLFLSVDPFLCFHSATHALLEANLIDSLEYCAIWIELDSLRFVGFTISSMYIF